MGHGARMLSLPCRHVGFPLVFNVAREEDRLLRVYAMSGKYHVIGSLVTSESFGSARCSKNTCGIPHAGRSATTTRREIVQEVPTNNIRITGRLPAYSRGSPDLIPVNEYGQRLDYYIKLPEPSVRKAFKDRFPPGKRLCGWYQLNGSCHEGSDCDFDHSELNPEFRLVLRHMVRRAPCKVGSTCRRLDCIYDHICQNNKCATEEMENCSLRRFHRVDPGILSWVEAETGDESSAEVSADAEGEQVSNEPKGSYWFSSCMQSERWDIMNGAEILTHVSSTRERAYVVSFRAIPMHSIPSSIPLYLKVSASPLLRPLT
jgi:hypothetical protein